MMKCLITTTAMAALLAWPLAAQQASQTETRTQEMQSGATETADFEIQASNLIGKRLYIRRDSGARDTGAMQLQETAPQDGQQTATDQARIEEESETEAGAQTAQDGAGMGATDDTGAGTDQTAQQTGGQQMPQDETETAGQTDEMQPSSEMADLREGVSEAPDNWTMAGEIDDVLMTQDGRIQALVIDAGGFLGMNDATRRVDIQDVRFVPDTDDQGDFFAVYTGGRQTFEQAESFDEATLQEGTVRGTEMWRDEIAGGQADIAFTSITTDELVGTAVYGSRDNWVGEISELALTEDGQIEAVVVDVGGFLGIGQKPVALGMEQIQLRRGEGGLFGDDLRAYVNATEEELESLEEWREEDAG